MFKIIAVFWLISAIIVLSASNSKIIVRANEAYFTTLDLLSTFSPQINEGKLFRGHYLGIKNVRGRDYHQLHLANVLAQKEKLLEVLLPTAESETKSKELSGTIIMKAVKRKDDGVRRQGPAYLCVNPYKKRDEYLRLVRFPQKSTYETPKDMLIATGGLAPDTKLELKENEVLFLCTLHLDKRIGANYCHWQIDGAGKSEPKPKGTIFRQFDQCQITLDNPQKRTKAQMAYYWTLGKNLLIDIVAAPFWVIYMIFAAINGMAR